jgi:hypothetical protein
MNLISDFDFELKDSCDETFSDSESYWSSFLGSVDLFSPCDSHCNYNGYIYTGYCANYPNNWAGYQQDIDQGLHFGGFVTYLTGNDLWNNTQEYPRATLKNRLTANHKYNFELYVSLADSFWYATRSLSVLFCSNSKCGEIVQCSQPGQEFNYPLFRTLFVPQWNYDGPYLNDKQGWTKISGSYIADGTEENMIIGNFCGDECGSDTLLVSPFSLTKNLFYDLYLYKGSYYYFDNVSLWEDTTYIGIEQPVFEQSKVFISENRINVFLSNNASPLSLELFDATGRQVYSVSLIQRESHFPTPQLSQGVYAYSLIYKGRVMKQGKVVN